MENIICPSCGAINGNQQGPFESEIIDKKVANGEITKSTLIWKKGLKQWIKIEEMEEFQHLFNENCPPPIPTL